MSDPENRDDLASAWQRQNTQTFRMSPEEIRMRIENIDRRLRSRTWITYLICASLTVFFGWWLLHETDNLFRTGAVLTVAALAWLAHEVREYRWRNPAAGADVPSLDFLRTELGRQVDFHRGPRFWARLLFLGASGMVFFAGFARAHPEVATTIRLEAIALAVLIVAAVPLNLWLAGRYQRQIDQLERLRKE